jgi:heterodisulfide reductase subunit C
MDFRHEIELLSGQDVNFCFQCSKCSAGCPVADKMDLKPAQVMHSIRLGLMEAVLNSRSIWLCLACETCSARCPQKVEPAAAMTAARMMALKLGVKPAVAEVGIYFKGFVDNMRLNGKIHDASVVAITRLMTGHLLDDLPLAFKLLAKGRIKPPPLPLGGTKYRKLHQRSLEKEGELYP